MTQPNASELIRPEIDEDETADSPIASALPTTKMPRPSSELNGQCELASGKALAIPPIRGTLTRTLVKPKQTVRTMGRVVTSVIRKQGNHPYVLQLLLTCFPLLLADLFALFLAVSVVSLVGFEWLNPEDVTSRAIVWLPSVAFPLVLINGVLGLYPGVRLGTVEEIQRSALSATIVGLIIASRLRPTSELFLGRVLFLLCAYALILFLVPIVRSRVRRMLAKTSWWGFPAIVCGDNAAVVGVCQWLEENRRLGLRPVGVVTSREVLELDNDTPWQVGSWEEARSMARRKEAYWAVIVESAEVVHDVASTVEKHLGNVPHVLVVSELTGIPDHWDRHQMDEGLPGFLYEQHLMLPIQRVIKQGMDLLIATIVGLLLLPLFTVLAILIKLTSRGPVFYGHARVGYGNTRFKAWKFRTMVDGAEKAIEDYLHDHPELRLEWERDHKLKNDPRVTPLGRFMRKWSIDELPQLWNVLCGEMSAVGPRPIVENEIQKYGEHIETFCTVLPGITGLWQVCGRNDTSFEDRIQLGLYYIHHWSPWLDLYLLAKTVRVVLFTKGAY